MAGECKADSPGAARRSARGLVPVCESPDSWGFSLPRRPHRPRETMGLPALDDGGSVGMEEPGPGQRRFSDAVTWCRVTSGSRMVEGTVKIDQRRDGWDGEGKDLPTQRPQSSPSRSRTGRTGDGERFPPPRSRGRHPAGRDRRRRAGRSVGPGALHDFVISSLRAFVGKGPVETSPGRSDPRQSGGTSPGGRPAGGRGRPGGSRPVAVGGKAAVRRVGGRNPSGRPQYDSRRGVVSCADGGCPDRERLTIAEGRR